MKTLTLTLVVVLIAAVNCQGWWGQNWRDWNRPRPTTAAPDVKCNSQEDCQEDECCAHDLNQPYYLIGTESYSGICRPLLTENRECLPQYDEPAKFGDVNAHLYCPCKSGLSCKATFYIRFGFRFLNGDRCVPVEEEGSGEEEA